MVNQIRTVLWKGSLIKKNEGNFCSWPRWSIKDQIYIPTQITKIRQNIWKSLRHQTSSIERQWPLRRGKHEEALQLPAYCLEKDSRLQQRDRKHNQSQRILSWGDITERLQRPWQFEFVGQRTKVWASSVMPCTIQQSPAQHIFIRKLPKVRERTTKGLGGWGAVISAHKDREQCLLPLPKWKKLIVLRKLHRPFKRLLLNWWSFESYTKCWFNTNKLIFKKDQTVSK